MDCIIDKASLDALLVDEGDPWSPNEEALDDAFNVLAGVFRSLKPGGHYIHITWAQPHFRATNYLKDPRLNWNVEYKTFGGGLGWFFYVCAKCIDGEQRTGDQQTIERSIGDPAITSMMKSAEENEWNVMNIDVADSFD